MNVERQFYFRSRSHKRHDFCRNRLSNMKKMKDEEQDRYHETEIAKKKKGRKGKGKKKTAKLLKLDSDV